MKPMSFDDLLYQSLRDPQYVVYYLEDALTDTNPKAMEWALIDIYKANKGWPDVVKDYASEEQLTLLENALRAD